MLRLTILGGLLAAGMLVFVPSLQAASYQFDIDAPSVVLPNTSFPINVYLRESPGDPLTSLIANEGGLLTAGVKITVLGSTALTPIVPTSASANPDFQDPSPVSGLTSSSISLQEALFIDVPTGPIGTVRANGDRYVPLGTFVFQSGTLGTTSLQVEDYAASDDTSTLFGTILDPSTVAPFQVAVTSTLPEPASLTLLALGSLGCLFRRRRC